MWRYTLPIARLFLSSILCRLIVIPGLLNFPWLVCFYLRLFDLLLTTIYISWVFWLVRVGLIDGVINISDNVLGVRSDRIRIIRVVWVNTCWVVYIVWAFRICIDFCFRNFLLFRFLVLRHLGFGVGNLILWIIIGSYNIFITSLAWIDWPIILHSSILICIPIVNRIWIRIWNRIWSRTFIISDLFPFIILIFWFLCIVIIFNLGSCFFSTLFFSMILYILVVGLWLFGWFRNTLASRDVDKIIFICDWF